MPTNLMAEVTQLFNILDQDSSGTLDVKEIKFFVRKVMGIADREESRNVARQLMTSIDKDGDHTLDVLEFAEGLAGLDFDSTSLEQFLEDAVSTAQAQTGIGAAKIAERAAEVFEHLDTDSSGTLGIKELKHFYRKIVGMSDKDQSRAAAIEMMEAMDLDHGHSLDLQEFTQGFQSMNQSKALAILANATKMITADNEKRIRKWAKGCFLHLDTDGSGTLGIKELKHFYRKIVGITDKVESRAAAVEFMKSMDSDNDHELTLEEFVGGFARMPRVKALSVLKNAKTVIEAVSGGAGASDTRGGGDGGGDGGDGGV